MSLLCPTSPELLVDQAGRPYFLWDVDMTLDDFVEALDDSDLGVRAYWIGKLMRQAKPDDVFTFVDPSEIGSLWSGIAPHLGSTLPFWDWLLSKWAIDRG